MSAREYFKTNLKGRLKTINLSAKNSLLPIFECVVNSIQSIEERAHIDKTFSISDGRIVIEFIYANNQLNFDLKNVPVIGFSICDNGCGFNTENYDSFMTFDSDYKERKGCKGIGRLQWLKEFEKANIYSKFIENGQRKERKFSFSTGGIKDIGSGDFSHNNDFFTEVRLLNVLDKYNDSLQKQVQNFSSNLLYHIILYYLNSKEYPSIEIKLSNKTEKLIDLFNNIKEQDISYTNFYIEDMKFDIHHIKIRNKTQDNCMLAMVANKRTVKTKHIKDDLGISLSLKDSKGEFSYIAFMSSDYFDQIVNIERTELNFTEDKEDLFTPSITKDECIAQAIIQIKSFFHDIINNENELKKNKIHSFMNENPNYKFLLDNEKISKEKLLDFSLKNAENELEPHLFKLKMNLIKNNISKGKQLHHRVLRSDEDFEKYQLELTEYLKETKEINKSDLVEYVIHRKIIIELLSKAICLQENNKHVKESVIHNLVFPMKTTFDSVFPDENNLWLIDERLSFNSYLTSDIPFKDMLITNSNSNKRPDILLCYDKPILLSDKQSNPFSSFTIIEFKRPMRNDISTKSNDNPIAQVLEYIKELHNNKLTTISNRPINAKNCPIYCYIIADLTPNLVEVCEERDFIQTADGNGYFGIIKNKNAFINVISYDGLLQGAKERNMALFDKLNIPNF